MTDDLTPSQRMGGHYWTRSGKMQERRALNCGLGLLHRVHHVEDGQIHRDNHAADDHAQHHDHDRLERSEEHTSELQSPCNLVCRLLLEKKNKYKHI